MFLTTNRQSPSSDCSTSALPKARQLLVPSFALGFKSKLSVCALAKMVITVIQSSSRVNLVICFNIIYFSRRRKLSNFGQRSRNTLKTSWEASPLQAFVRRRGVWRISSVCLIYHRRIHCFHHLTHPPIIQSFRRVPHRMIIRITIKGRIRDHHRRIPFLPVAQ